MDISNNNPQNFIVASNHQTSAGRVFDFVHPGFCNISETRQFCLFIKEKKSNF
jgi:hypothetical protein